MNKRKTFLWLAAASGYIGAGLILGYLLSDQASNSPLLVGGVLMLFGAVLLGMHISSRRSAVPDTSHNPTITNE